MNARYARQIILPEVGEAGQEKLAGASVLIVGAGGLGCPVALYLAAAGVGHLFIADADEVRLNNLNRQIVYNESDLGRSKVEQAKKRLEEFNSRIEIETLGKIDDQKITKILSDSKIDLVIDATDNFETRYAVNNVCVEKDVPFVHGSVLGWQGQVSVFDATKGPCYQCIYPEPPPLELSPTCVSAGIIGVTPGVIGVLEATEAIKMILGEGEQLIGKMLLVDLIKMNFKTLELIKDPKCSACG